jgi:hypothetical protein
MKWRVAVDRAVAPLGPPHAQCAIVASPHGMQRSGLRPSRRRLADRAGREALYVSKPARGREPAGTRDPDDPRAVQLALTEQGRETTRKAIEVVQGLLRQSLAPLGGPGSPRAQPFTRDLAILPRRTA